MTMLAQLSFGQVLDQRYRIDKQLGEGGMGTVYLAVHLGTERPVAIKVISSEFMADKEFVERFKQEAKAAGRLRHPNVVNVTDFGFARLGSEQIAYLVMEFLDGCTLGEMLEKRRQLPLKLIVDIVEQVCSAIDAAHQKGIIHRDLKPDNIWLEPNGRGGYNAKILDFGLAKLRDFAASNLTAGSPLFAGSNVALHAIEEKFEPLNAAVTLKHSDPAPDAAAQIKFDGTADDEKTRIMKEERRPAGGQDRQARSLTRMGAILGTPLYMSPEQCLGKKVDARSDIYSLGVITYQMLTGETPFSGSLKKLLTQHINSAPPAILESRPDIPKPVADLVISALAKDPAERPPTAGGFAFAMRFNLDGEAALLRQAFELYRKNLLAFTTISARVMARIYLLLFSFNYILLSLSQLPVEIMRSSTFVFAYNSLWLLSIPLILLAAAANSAVCVYVVEQLRNAPGNYEPISPIAALFKQRLPALAVAMVRSFLSPLAHILKSVSSESKGDNNYSFADCSLYSPIVMSDGEFKDAAFAHSKRLVSNLRSIAFRLRIRDLAIASAALILFLLTPILYGLLFDILMPPFTALVTRDPLNSILIIPFAFIPAIFIILFHPINGIATALLFFKALQVNGAKPNETLSEAVEADDAYEELLKPRKRSLILITILPAVLLGWFILKDKALNWASSNNRISAVKALIAAGADVNSRDELQTALTAAAANGHTEAMRKLIAAGADVNSHDGFGTALTAAANNGEAKAVQVLIGAGAKLNARSYNGNTALMWSAGKGHIQVVKELIDAGADLNAKGDEGYTALLDAAINSRIEVQKMLIEAGADVNAKSNDGKTALKIAEGRGQREMIKLLTASGAVN